MRELVEWSGVAVSQNQNTMEVEQEETYADRQENELSVLQAMFMDDFQRIEPSAGEHAVKF